MKSFTAIHKKRLLEAASIVARVKPNNFSMHKTGRGGCDTPACVWGHYVRKYPRADRYDADGYWAGIYLSAIPRFGLSYAEAAELFSGNGCGNAQTPKAAAAYIRNFVKRKEAA